MDRYLKQLDNLFSLFVFVVIVLLACYMAVRIGFGGYNFFLSVFSGELIHQDSMSETSRFALQSIAETVILIKAYRILISYLRQHHISVEYIVEISIIAPAIELLFASHSYDLYTKIILGVFGLVNLFLYLHFFGPEHDEELHQHREKHSRRS